MGTRTSIAPKLVSAALCGGALLLAGCGGAGDAVSKFAGGTSSRDKKQVAKAATPAEASPVAGQTPSESRSEGEARSIVPVPVQASAAGSPAVVPAPAAPAKSAPTLASAPTPGAATPGIQGPAAVSKGVDKTVPATEEERKALRQKRMAYKARRHRDPFLSLVGSDKQNASGLVDLSVVTLVGVVSSDGGAFCIVEDAEGTSFILRKGDRVKNGRVVSIANDKMTASQTVLGYTTTLQLKLENEKDGIHG